MDWKRYDDMIRRFSRELDCEIGEDNVHAIGQSVEIITFKDNDELEYEFRHSKPFTSIGSRLKIASPFHGKEVFIQSKRWIFLKPKLKIKNGVISLDTRNKLSELQTRLGAFKWRTNGKLKFTTKFIDLEIETLRLIREIHLEIKE